jgi:3-phosphoshikimate 1-carboxyvinyltransferase
LPATSPLTVEPGPPLTGRVMVPGDKSITHRAYVLGLLAGGDTEVRGANPGADCRATLRCVEALGGEVGVGEDAVHVHGTGGRLAEPAGDLDCGNSGTTLRLLAGVLAAQPFEATLSGDESLRRRPVDRVIEPLRAMGASLSGRDGDRLPPLVVRGGPLEGMCFPRPTASAQVAGAILLAGVQARGSTTVLTSSGVRDHTSRMLRRFGVPVEERGLPDGATRVGIAGPGRLRGCSLRVPGDFSAAAFFLVAAAVRPGARVTVPAVGLNDSRIQLLDTLKQMGAVVEMGPIVMESGEPVGEVSVTGPEELRPWDISPAEVARLVDEIPAWAIAASAARGTSRLRGAEELRLKESDRLHALAEGLRVLGVRVEEFPDGLDIHGGPVGGGLVRGFGDHRIAMAFAILGTRASGPVTVDDGSCIATSYPRFGEALRSLGGRVAQARAAGEAP